MQLHTHAEYPVFPFASRSRRAALPALATVADDAEPRASSPGVRGSRILLPLAFSLAAVLLIVIGALASGSGRAAAWQWAQATVEVLAAIECARTARRLVGRARLVWALFAGGLTIWLVTDLAYGLVRLRGVVVPEVSPFDVGWLLFFVPVLVGVLFLYGTLRPERGWQGALDGVLVGLAFGLTAWTLLLQPQISGQDRGLSLAVDLLYPALDLVALCALGWLVARHRTRAPSWLWWIVAAFGLQAGADLAYVVFAVGDRAGLAGLAAVLYAAGAMLWVGAARSRRRHPQRTWSPGRRDAPPGWSRALPFVLAAGVEALALFGPRSPYAERPARWGPRSVCPPRSASPASPTTPEHRRNSCAGPTWPPMRPRPRAVTARSSTRPWSQAPASRDLSASDTVCGHRAICRPLISGSTRANGAAVD